MRKAKCINGHFFDLDRFSVCPSCSGAAADLVGNSGQVNNQVVSRRSRADEIDKTERLIENNLITGGASLVEAKPVRKVSEPMQRVARFSGGGLDEMPAGWLVCVAGAYRGTVFTCKCGINRIGRVPGMDICLWEDASISSENHGAVIYNPRQRVFFLRCGQGIVYRNDDMLLPNQNQKLEAYDRVALGGGKYVFVPLCSDRFFWEKEGD